jgi:hypothetical protein
LLPLPLTINFHSITFHKQFQNMSKKLLILPAILLGAVLVFTNTSCGEKCKFDQKDFVGQYNVQEKCSASQASNYNVTISAGTSETDVKIGNFWGLFNNSVNATIDCDIITIARQEPDNDKFFVEGSGVIEKNDGNITINMSYKVTDETDSTVQTDNCNSTVYTKLK